MYRLRQSTADILDDAKIRARTFYMNFEPFINKVNEYCKTKKINFTFILSLNNIIEFVESAYQLSAVYQYKCVFTNENLTGKDTPFGYRLYEPKKIAIHIYCLLALQDEIIQYKGTLTDENKQVLIQAKEFLLNHFIYTIIDYFFKTYNDANKEKLLKNALKQSDHVPDHILLFIRSIPSFSDTNFKVNGLVLYGITFAFDVMARHIKHKPPKINNKQDDNLLYSENDYLTKWHPYTPKFFQGKLDII